MLERSSGISNLTVTTPIVVANFFFKGILESKQVTKSANGSKNNVAEWYIFLNRALNSSEDLPV